MRPIRPIGLIRPILLIFALVSPLRAQYWSAMPKIEDGPVCACFSQDDKTVYFVSKDSGVANVFRVPAKGGAPQMVTRFVDAPVVRAVHLTGKPMFVYMKGSAENPTDYHIYKLPDAGGELAVDLTPTKPGVKNEIIGASYNGRYIYYKSN